MHAPYAFAAAKRYVILNAKRERIRNPLKRETDCRAPCGARNDRTMVCYAFYGD